MAASLTSQVLVTHRARQSPFGKLADSQQQLVHCGLGGSKQLGAFYSLNSTYMSGKELLAVTETLTGTQQSQGNKTTALSCQRRKTQFKVNSGREQSTLAPGQHAVFLVSCPALCPAMGWEMQSVA
jgi:hypothetical protein